MADNKDDEFKDIDFVEADAPAAIRTEPMTFEERLIVQNLFDTQPKRRAAYLKQIGLELDPNDTNKYRPLGSQDEFHAEIDPGVGYITQEQGGLAKWAKANAKELGQDLTDIVGDAAASLISTLTAKGGEALGAGLGAGGGPATLATARVIGGVAGGALGAAAAEVTKEQMGNLYLNKDIPSDKKLLAVQSLIAGLAPAVIKGGIQGTKAAYSAMLNRKANGIIATAKKAGGQGLTPELMIEAAEKEWTEESIEGASKKISDRIKQVFGVGPDEAFNPTSTRQIKPDSVVGQAIKPLNEAADVEISKLSVDPAANWKAGEILEPIRSHIANLKSKFSLNSEETAALKYLQGKQKFIESKARELNPKVKDIDQLMQTEFNFKQGREFLKTLQDDGFNREIPGSGYIKQFAGGLRRAADEKAGRLGSALPQINEKRAAVLDAYKVARANITPNKMMSAYVGSDTPTKELIKESVAGIDATLGTQLGQEFETLGKQRIIETLFKNPQSFGSGGVAGPMLEGAIKGGATGAAVGSVVPVVGTKAGAIVGALKGAADAATLAKPQELIKAATSTAAKQRAIQASIDKGVGVVGQTAAAATGRAAAGEYGTSQYDPQELANDEAALSQPQEDEFKDLDF